MLNKNVFFFIFRSQHMKQLGIGITTEEYIKTIACPLKPEYHHYATNHTNHVIEYVRRGMTFD